MYNYVYRHLNIYILLHQKFLTQRVLVKKRIFHNSMVRNCIISIPIDVQWLQHAFYWCFGMCLYAETSVKMDSDSYMCARKDFPNQFGGHSLRHASNVCEMATKKWVRKRVLCVSRTFYILYFHIISK